MYAIAGELYHSGTTGMRWYHRYHQSYNTVPTRSGKVGIFHGKESTKEKTKKDDKKVQNETKTQSAEDRAAEKEKALRSGSAEDVLKFQGELSNEELQRALNRINLEKQLGQLSAKDKKSAADKVDKIINGIDKARNWTEKGINAYNTAAKIINAFSAEDDLPIIGQSKPSKSQRESADLKNMIMKLQAENNKLKNDQQKLQNKQLENQIKREDKQAKKDENKEKKETKKK